MVTWAAMQFSHREIAVQCLSVALLDCFLPCHSLVLAMPSDFIFHTVYVCLYICIYTYINIYIFMCVYIYEYVYMYVYTGSLHHLEYFDFSCASIPDGWWQFVKEELIYIYIIHIIFIYILYILHVQMLFFIFNFLPLPRPPSCSQEVACFRFMMRLTDHVPFLCPLLLTCLSSCCPS